MIVVYTFGPAWGMLDASPFCTRLLAYLALAEIEFENRPGLGHLRRAPKGKLPYVRLEDGSELSDSGLIIEALEERSGTPLDAALDLRDRALSHALQRTLCEHFYWCVVSARWADRDNVRRYTIPEFFGGMPAWQRPLVSAVVRRQVLAQLRAQGLGRHDPETRASLGRSDLRALAAALGDRTFLFGDRPTTADACAYAFLDAVLRPPHRTGLTEAVRALPALVDYHARMDARIR